MPYLEVTPILLLIRTIEIFAHIFLLNTILRKKISKFKYALSTFLVVSLYELSAKIIPFNYKFITMFVLMLCVMPWILKINLYKVALGYVITMLIIALLDMLCVVFVFVLLGINNLELITNSSYSYITMTILVLLIFIVSFAIKYFNVTFTDADSSNKNLGIAFNSLLTLLFVFPSSLVIIYYIEEIPLSINIIIVNLITMFAMLVLSIYNSQKRYNLILSEQELEYQKSYNTNLKSLVDGLRTFKHDYNNTLATLSGYVQLGDISALKRVFKEVLDESKTLMTLDKLNPDLIKNPSIYGLMTSKYQKCEKNNVSMNLEIFADLENMEIRIFDLTRVLGIFLDNAIEAASGSKERKLNILISELNNKIIIEISNTFSDKAISVDRIFDKGISSKGKGRGLGLYKVKDIVKRYPSVTLSTYIDEGMFLQKLTIQKNNK